MTLELMTELMPGAGPPLTTIPKHFRVSIDVMSFTHESASFLTSPQAFLSEWGRLVTPLRVQTRYDAAGGLIPEGPRVAHS